MSLDLKTTQLIKCKQITIPWHVGSFTTPHKIGYVSDWFSVWSRRHFWAVGRRFCIANMSTSEYLRFDLSTCARLYSHGTPFHLVVLQLHHPNVISSRLRPRLSSTSNFPQSSFGGRGSPLYEISHSKSAFCRLKWLCLSVLRASQHVYFLQSAYSDARM
jgi:hypothetical protein